MNEVSTGVSSVVGDLGKIFYPESNSFKVVTPERVSEIANKMPEMHRAISAFGKQNSQTTGTLMTLSMLTGGPYRVLRQILAQVNSRLEALREAYFDLREKEIRAKMAREKCASETDPLKRELLLVKAMRLDGQVVSSKNAVEGALKTIGMYQEAYEQIRESNNIPKNWDEADFEKAEVEHHIRCAFRLAIRDVHMTGRLNVATCEYLEQYGISPAQAENDVSSYIWKTKDILNSAGRVGIEVLYEFLDEMVQRYREQWKISAGRLGLKSPIFERWLYTEDK